MAPIDRGRRSCLHTCERCVGCEEERGKAWETEKQKKTLCAEQGRSKIELQRRRRRLEVVRVPLLAFLRRPERHRHTALPPRSLDCATCGFCSNAKAGSQVLSWRESLCRRRFQVCCSRESFSGTHLHHAPLFKVVGRPMQVRGRTTGGRKKKGKCSKRGWRRNGCGGRQNNASGSSAGSYSDPFAVR